MDVNNNISVYLLGVRSTEEENFIHDRTCTVIVPFGAFEELKGEEHLNVGTRFNDTAFDFL